MLTSAQKEAIAHGMGPCLVLAGPGAGKTLVLTRRIHHLITAEGVPPEQILVITFTKAAAKEMQERFLSMCEKSAPVSFGTFHSVFFAMLRGEQAHRRKKLLLGKEKRALIKEVFASAKVAIESEDDLQQLEKEISLMKNTMVAKEEFCKQSFFEEAYVRLYEHYEARKAAYSYMDFDDLLTVTYGELLHNPKFLQKWQEKFCYILIDEVQDMNDLQFEIIKLLALPENNLFFVGDEDQSIYGFRGANPGIMMKFSSVYPDGKQILLIENFRCRPEVLDVANHLISHNQCRFEKSILAKREDGGSVSIMDFETEDKQQQFFSDVVKKEKNCAMLFRGHNSLQMMAVYLEKHNIPFYMKERLPNILQKEVCADVMAYLRLTSDALHRNDVYRVMNKPNRFLARASVKSEWTTFAAWKSYYKEQSWLYDRIALLQKDVLFLKKLSGSGALLYLKRKMGYEQYLRDSSATSEELEDKLAQFSMCEFIARDTKSVTELLEKLKEAQWLLDREQKKEKREGVALMTLHGSKGLEFDAVCIPYCNETYLPSKKAQCAEQIEEERRLFFVGITRAKERVYLGYVQKKDGEALSPSRFLKELESAR